MPTSSGLPKLSELPVTPKRQALIDALGDRRIKWDVRAGGPWTEPPLWFQASLILGQHILEESPGDAFRPFNQWRPCRFLDDGTIQVTQRWTRKRPNPVQSIAT